MRKLLLVAGLSIVLLSFAWTRESAPAPEINYTPVSQAVTMSFDLNRVSATGAELSLNDRRVRGPMFIQFDVSARNGGSLVMTGMGNRSQGRGAQARAESLPEWPFLRDRSGQAVLQFVFEHQIAEDPSGNPAMRMTYVGRDVPLINSMSVPRPTTVPPFVSEHFGVDGPIQFQPGEYRIDPRINGFWIPIRILGR